MSMVFHLILTTLAEEEVQLIIDLQEQDGLQEFENAVLEQLSEAQAAPFAASWTLSVTRNRSWSIPSGRL